MSNSEQKVSFQEGEDSEGEWKRGERAGEKILVWDLDTTLNFPEEFDVYVCEALWDSSPHLLPLQKSYRRCFRLVPAVLYLSFFASDRLHMRRKDGSWLAPPPPYPCIRPQSCGTEHEDENNLMSYVRMSEDEVELLICDWGLLITSKFGIVV
eukprot:TRINITY_DN5633_c0_g1_i5.p1 TRINITY_DN5633_c0_g1~~TRINITY_DN5633_c0_g1_i5.p1  ORF type:complete len:153 (+),score=31.41 TRINITY_DN5633_c0_g1_i5:216-674(+)